MRSRLSPSRVRRVGHIHLLEFLEDRRLLAGDFQTGDANQDYYYDEADLIQVAKFGKYETGETAEWEEGDWNDDGEFNSVDLVLAINEGPTRGIPYDEAAGDAVNQLAPISDMGAADVTLFYSPVTGDVTAISAAPMTALHLFSRSGSFDGYRVRPFGVATAESQFVFDPEGHTWIEHPALLPIGWSAQQVIDDLLVDGALFAGGGLGNVLLGSPADFPSERPEDVFVSAPKSPPTFVERDEANGLLTYDPQTGDIRIESFDVAMELIELASPEGLFIGTIGAEDLYTVHTFDEAKPERFLRVAWDTNGPVNGHITLFFTDAFSRVYLPGIAQVGLTAEEFAAGVHPTGAVNPRDSLDLALEVGLIYSGCESQISSGTLVGDANGDGQFDSTDLVSVFQAGEYEDAVAHNSTWSEGDWTCDGDFDTSDLVAAFQAGNYESAAGAIALRTDSQIALDDSLGGRGTTVERTALAAGVGLPGNDVPVASAIPLTVSVLQGRAGREFVQPLATDKVMTDLESWFCPDEDWKHESPLTERDSTLTSL